MPLLMHQFEFAVLTFHLTDAIVRYVVVLCDLKNCSAPLNYHSIAEYKMYDVRNFLPAGT